MCGIAGALYREPGLPVQSAVLCSMGEAIAHRGPDDAGFFQEPGIGLAHRRLSIIDLSTGDQPMANEDGSVQVVFNGEIYNYQPLREKLLAKGHTLKSRSDTEVLVHLYEDHGEDLVHHLRGMFAFALWDKKRHRLLLARDRIGIKPLYFYQDSDKFLFGSELKAILAHPGVDRRLNAMALEDYLAYGMVPGAQSIFRSIKKLAPAQTMLVDQAAWRTDTKTYWRLQFEADEKTGLNEWKECIRAKLSEAVKLHLIADVPVGAFLSGGIDSSVLVACASGGTQGKLRTFTMGFKEAAFSELPYAREVATQYGTDHVEEIVSPEAAKLVDELTTYYDEPFADSSAVPTFLVSRLAKRYVKVALSGDGGDEAFGGYARYAHDLREASLRDALPAWLRQRVLGPLGGIWPKADWLPRPLRAKTRLTNLGLDASGAYANTLMLCRQPLRRRLIRPPLHSNGHRPEDIVTEAFRQAPETDPLAGMISADVATVLPDDFLVKVDRASMANGLEVRPPLLDHELLEMAATIPGRYKVHKGETKWIFKQAFLDRLPESIRNRPKQGFEIPVDSWLRGPLKGMFEASVLCKSAPVGGLIDQAQAESLFRGHCRKTGRHGAVLWSLLMLARWSERYQPTID